MAHVIKEKATNVATKLSAHQTESSTEPSLKPSVAGSPSLEPEDRDGIPRQYSDEMKRDLSWAREQQYLLRVSAGPEYDPSTHTVLEVNGSKSLSIENDSIKAQLKVYIRNYNGLPLGPAAPSSSAYFKANTRQDTQYSIAFNFVPKHDIDADEATWGIEHDEAVRDRLPPGFNLAVKLVKTVVDPSIDLDGYADKPWVYAPALTSWFAWRMGEKKKVEEWDALPDVDDERPLDEGGGDYDASIRKQLSVPDDGEARKKHFRSVDHRQAFGKFEAGRLYQADFFNSYIDFSEFAVCLPGMKIHCLKYINDKTHRIRWVFKESRVGKMLFCVVFTLLHGQELQDAVDEEERKVKQTHETREQPGFESAEGHKRPQTEQAREPNSNEMYKSASFPDQPEDVKLGLGDMKLEDTRQVLKEHGL